MQEVLDAVFWGVYTPDGMSLAENDYDGYMYQVCNRANDIRQEYALLGYSFDATEAEEGGCQYFVDAYGWDPREWIADDVRREVLRAGEDLGRMLMG
jgi:hypothetical protein